MMSSNTAQPLFCASVGKKYPMFYGVSNTSHNSNAKNGFNPYSKKCRSVGGGYGGLLLYTNITFSIGSVGSRGKAVKHWVNLSNGDREFQHFKYWNQCPQHVRGGGLGISIHRNGPRTRPLRPIPPRFAPSCAVARDPHEFVRTEAPRPERFVAQLVTRTALVNQARATIRATNALSGVRGRTEPIESKGDCRLSIAHSPTVSMTGGALPREQPPAAVQVRHAA
jgi:hypothetical protein